MQNAIKIKRILTKMNPYFNPCEGAHENRSIVVQYLGAESTEHKYLALQSAL
jgi:hypothetical protein